MRKPLWAILLLAAAATARADSFPVTGTAFVSTTDLSFQLAGTNFSLLSPAPDGNGILGSCQQGTFCDLTRFVPAVSTFTSGNLSYPGVFNGQEVLIFGGLTFSGTLFAPILTGQQSQVLSIPVTFFGQVDIFSFLIHVGIGTELASFNLSGTGTLDTFAVAGQGTDFFPSGVYTFQGTATPIPEPTSLVLFASGLAGLGALLCQRGRRIQ